MSEVFHFRIRYRANLGYLKEFLGDATVTLTILKNVIDTPNVNVWTPAIPQIRIPDNLLVRPLPLNFSVVGSQGISLTQMLPFSEKYLLFGNVKTRLMFEVFYSCAMIFIELANSCMNNKE